MKRERIAGIDFMRAICALLIVLYHIVIIYQSNPVLDVFPIKAVTDAGNWSITIVSVFFMISGASLYYNYPKIEKGTLHTFYFKRWKSLFPAFFLVWLCTYIETAVQYKSLFYAADPKYLLLSLFGLDGYFAYLHPNFYITGEWFLGAIVLLYVLYPLLLFLFNRIKWIMTAVITALFVWLMIFNPFQIEKSQNLICCMFDLWLGMLYIKHRAQLKKLPWLGVVSLIPCLILAFAPLGMDDTAAMILAAIFLFLFLEWASDYVFRLKPLKSFFLTTSGLSYEVFLVHHTLVYHFIDLIIKNGTYNFNLRAEWIYTILVFFPVFLYAKALSLLIKAFCGTPFFRRIEGFFVQQK